MSNLLNAVRPLVWDFLSTIIFATLVALHVDVRIATAVAVGAGVAQVLGMKALGRHVELLQWASLGLTLVFGTVSLVTRDPRFIMAKPSIIYTAIAIVMLKRGWMVRYLPAIARNHGADLMTSWGYAWAGLMALTAVLNLIVAVAFTREWPAFMAVWPLVSKLGLFAIQYVHVHHVVRGRVIAERQAQAETQAHAEAQPA
jgi:intracellular septation protein A